MLLGVLFSMSYEIDEKKLEKEYYAIQGRFEGKWNVLEKFETEDQALKRIKELIAKAAEKKKQFSHKRIVFIKELSEFSIKIDSEK